MANFTGSLIGGILRYIFGRWSRRARARHELERLRSDINACAAIFVGSTQGGTVPQLLLPIGSATCLASLHSDGLLSDAGFDTIRTFFGPAEQANLWLTAPPQQGPLGMNGAQHLASLLRGKHYVEARDGNGATLRDRALSEVAEALSTISRRRRNPW